MNNKLIDNNEIIEFSAPELYLNIRKTNFVPNSKTRGLHYHNEIEIVKVTKGNVSCMVDNDEFVLTESKMLFINKRILHQIHFHKDNCQCVFMQINLDKYLGVLRPDRNNHLYNFLKRTDEDNYAIFEAENEISDIFDGICNEFELKKTGYEIYIKSKIFNIIGFMCRNGLIPSDNAISKKHIQKILPAIEYAEKNYSKKIYLDNLCRDLNIDKFYFCKVFKKITGSSFMDYVNYLRLYHAENLLSSSGKNISEIAYLCGFNSIQYFNRTFKLHKGCSPSKFRKIRY